jgi:hypothetical protein
MQERNITKFQIGLIIPWLLVSIGAVDLGLRLVPRDTASRFGVDRVTLMTPHGSRWRGVFEPNLSIKLVGCGRIAEAANLPSLCVPQEAEYHTDEWNHMNEASAHLPGASSVLLVGDSFGVFSESGFENDFARLLAREMGQGLYNASRPGLGPVSSGAIMDLLDRLQMKRGTVVFETSDTSHPPRADPPDQDGARRHFWGLLSEQSLALPRYSFYKLTRQDGAFYETQKWLHKLQNDLILPHADPYWNSSLIEKLRDGEEIGLLPGDRTSQPEENTNFDPEWERYWLDLSVVLHSRGVQLVVVLIPRKFIVYGPLLANPAPQADVKASYWRSLENSLRGDGIPVVNMTDPFRQAANEALGHGELIYPRDESHWGFKAREMAAERVAQELRCVLSADSR